MGRRKRVSNFRDKSQQLKPENLQPDWDENKFYEGSTARQSSCNQQRQKAHCLIPKHLNFIVAKTNLQKIELPMNGPHRYLGTQFGYKLQISTDIKHSLRVNPRELIFNPARQYKKKKSPVFGETLAFDYLLSTDLPKDIA